MDATNTNNASRQLPQYQCHKKVWALKIKSIKAEPQGWTVTPEDEGFAPFVVDSDYVKKHNPRAGGYYVVYDDRYKSYSPAEAFESGYTRI